MRRAYDKSIPAKARNFALKHGISLSLARIGPEGKPDFYFIRLPSGELAARYMTASGNPQPSHAIAMMRRWLSDHGKGSTMKKNPVGKKADREAVRELLIFADSESSIYGQRVAIHKALLKRLQRGTYDHAKAIKAWRNWIDAAAKAYGAVNLRPTEWKMVFSPATRTLAARVMASKDGRVLKMAARGETDQFVYTKNPHSPKVGKIVFQPRKEIRGEVLAFTSRLFAKKIPGRKGWFVHGHERTGNYYGGNYVTLVAWPNYPVNKRARSGYNRAAPGWRTQAEAKRVVAILTRYIQRKGLK